MKPGLGWRGETRALNHLARQDAPGSFVHLARGYTHFETVASSRDRPVVLVHGFSVPYFIWDPTFVALVDAGHCPIRYDLYGRGYSDRPRVAYNLDLFVDQLEQLMDTLGFASANLIGLSMGGPIAAAFTVRFPQRVRRLVLIAPSGTRPISLGPLYSLAILPGLSDLVFRAVGTDYMLNAVAQDFFDQSMVDTFRERYRVQMQYFGFRRAILSSVRHGMLGGFAETYARLGLLHNPVLLIWGEQDTTVPFQHARMLRTLIPHASFLAIPRCGHIPHFEHPEVVNPRLLDFLN